MTNFLLGSLDANLKARKAEQTGMNLPQHLYWRELPGFYKQEYPVIFALVRVIAPVGLKFMLSLSWMYVVYDLILAGAGNESLWYWWSQPIWNISQKQTFGGKFRKVGWFEYPDRAPWMNQMFWLRYFDRSMPENVTRQGLYRANMFAIWLCCLIMIFNRLLFTIQSKRKVRDST